MGEKLVIGPINRGLKTDLTAFNIDNDAFPKLNNAYQWRGRAKRKRGTSLLCRAQKQVINISLGTTDVGGAFSGNLLSTITFPNASVVLKGITLTVAGAPPQVFTNPSIPDGTLTPNGTIDYITGQVSIQTSPVLASAAVNATFDYYPGLPAMGFEDKILDPSDFPGTIAFDTRYAYEVSTSFPYPVTDITYYYNPPGSGSLPGYIPKAAQTGFNWNGTDYQQFGSVNYQSAFWTTNGMQVPFSSSNLGMQFVRITGATYSGSPTDVVLTIPTPVSLLIGDFIFLNEIGGITGVNFQTGYVTAIVGTSVTVRLPNAILTGAYTSGGIAQYLTNTAIPGKDCIRYYTGNGWVNFMPPLSQFNFDISDENFAQYYLVGAKIIYSFKDRLIFFGPVIQTSAVGANPIYLPDTACYSWNGTPYYTASFVDGTSGALNATNILALLTPSDETAHPAAYFEDQLGFGGFVQASLAQPIVTVAPNADALIIGFNPTTQARFMYTGNDLLPFEFYVVNSELGSSSTFSTVTMDQGVITRGPKGFLISSQSGTQRIDLDILDQPFEISNAENGSERFCAQRDFQNEWVYFTYRNDNALYIFPNQSLQYNYRDNSWAVFDESYTTYGIFREQTGFTWETVGEIYPTWESWTDNWESGSANVLEPVVVGGNQQGFFIRRAQGLDEANSLYIKGFSSSIVNCPDHTLNNLDYIIINGCLGTIGYQVNNQIFQIRVIDKDNFELGPTIGSGTYLGGGLIKRMYVPVIQSKQFPLAWGDGRKTRLGPQQYLLTKTSIGQVQLLIYLSQDGANAYNDGPVYPLPNSQNDSLIYSTVLYTCPESTNLGLTSANVNLQMPTASNQNQIWHRINTSLLGDTVQFAITISPEQMMSYTPVAPYFDITGISLSSPCVIQVVNTISAQSIVLIEGVSGMTPINGKRYFVISSTPTSITVNLDTTNYPPYLIGGTVVVVSPIIQTLEVELHSAILDVSQSSLLS